MAQGSRAADGGSAASTTEHAPGIAVDGSLPCFARFFVVAYPALSMKKGIKGEEGQELIAMARRTDPLLDGTVEEVMRMLQLLLA